jgi:hypothetical protein
MKTDESHDFSIVAVDKFIHATRDSGYKGTPSAVAELVDNALQAGATEIKLVLVSEEDVDFPITLKIIDNGTGMDRSTLRTALRFGGSTRFNSRSGLGRYGMGLPNSSLSQAQRVTVHTWAANKGDVLETYIDLNEIAAGEMREVPSPSTISRPAFINGYASGTAVTWSRCDRLDARKVSTLERRLALTLGRQFRHFLWSGTRILINGDLVRPIDPLFLNEEAVFSGASEFASFEREIPAIAGDPTTTGLVRIRFSELPVAEWSKLSNEAKRARGIAKGAGISIVRAGREVDYGWFFLGGKRRENYDDWWRCEVQFDPVLDETFGITHTKQQIRPRQDLIEALSADIENTARAVNSRARKAHMNVKLAERLSSSEECATKRDSLLTQLSHSPRGRDRAVLDKLKRELKSPDLAQGEWAASRYRIVPKALSDTCFFNYARSEGNLVLVLNPDHQFYRYVYQPLLESEDQRDVRLRTSIDLLLLAAARAEALLEEKDELRVAEQLRTHWSDTLATFLDG